MKDMFSGMTILQQSTARISKNIAWDHPFKKGELDISPIPNPEAFSIRQLLTKQIQFFLMQSYCVFKSELWIGLNQIDNTEKIQWCFVDILFHN